VEPGAGTNGSRAGMARKGMVAKVGREGEVGQELGTLGPSSQEARWAGR
jgi:hypothetical protein